MEVIARQKKKMEKMKKNLGCGISYLAANKLTPRTTLLRVRSSGDHF
jgi:hypothetical protein